MFVPMQVEGEELEVLRGLDAADWARVQQVALEVHDCIDSGVRRVGCGWDGNYNA
jgi:hypothetical protein